MAAVETLQSAHKEAMDNGFEVLNQRFDKLEGWIVTGVIAIFTLAGALIAVLVQNALD